MSSGLATCTPEVQGVPARQTAGKVWLSPLEPDAASVPPAGRSRWFRLRLACAVRWQVEAEAGSAEPGVVFHSNLAAMGFNDRT